MIPLLESQKLGCPVFCRKTHPDLVFAYPLEPLLTGLLGELCSGMCCILPGEMAAADSDAIYKHLFTDIPAQLFHNSSLAFEFVLFCKDNSRLFTETSSIFRQSFPNLFKVHLAGAAQETACCASFLCLQILAFSTPHSPPLYFYGRAQARGMGKKDLENSEFEVERGFWV